MRDLEGYALLCMELLDNLNIPYGDIQEVVPNTRAGSRWGQCQRKTSGFSISINADLLQEANAERGLVNTLLHEMLHTCPGCMNHGDQWKKYADSIFRAYGINVKRTSSAADKGVVERTVGQREEYKYKLRCDKCGRMWKYKRASKTVRNHSKYIHSGCGGKLILTEIYDQQHIFEEKQR